jgi:hypothetical protein
MCFLYVDPARNCLNIRSLIFTFGFCELSRRKSVGKTKNSSREVHNLPATAHAVPSTNTRAV